jgi:uncharacterized protein DUF4252
MKLLFQKLCLPLIAVVLVMMAALVTQAQDPRIQTASLDHLAAKASQTVDVNIDERLIRLAAKLLSDKGDEKEVKELVTGIKGIYVKSFEFDADGQYTPADIESIRSQLRAPSWSRLLNVSSKKEGSLEVYVLLNGEVIGGLAVIAAEQREFTVVNIVGPVDINKLAKLQGEFGVPELGIEPKQAKPKNDQ